MHRFPAADPIVLLEPFRSTLEQLDLSVIHCEDETVQYPHVRSLTLADCYHGMLRGGIDVGPVARAFPNVETFTLSAAKVHPEASQWSNGRCCDHTGVIERCRVMNQQYWRCEDGAGDDAAWQSLTHVAVGHVIDLYMLGLCRPVPRVEIKALSESTAWMLPHVLADTRPSSLVISLFARDYVLASLPRLFSPADGASLTRFSLDFRCDVPEVNVDQMVANLTALLAPLRVEHLSIRLARWDSAGPYRLSQDGLLAIDDALARIGDAADTVASQLMDRIPLSKALTMEVGRREARTMRK
ncbi:hypothetical protein L226DRAFT_572965 [Lentinus tigrinus ALCF2SS1-7]|nr:hypothetical protein L226DRAFT_572965 [Lentinus tigrinus ALCF2SS1-7]